MNIRRIFSLLVAVVCVGACAFAQELNCEVEINSSKIQNANKEVFTTLQQTISEYMNTTKWTDAQFGNNEKIQCKLFLTVNTYDDGSGKMTGDLQIQSQRPVYNSSYTPQSSISKTRKWSSPTSKMNLWCIPSRICRAI